MIVIRIKGGLGNQLFQYASAKGLAASLGRRLKMDSLTGFPRDQYRRSYRLHRFALPEVTASASEVWLARALSCRRWLGLRRAESRALQRGEFFLPWLERDLPGAAVYLEAYLQSPRYFSQIEAQVRRELSAQLLREPAAHDYLRLAEGVAAVSIHVRRQDYSRRLTADYYRRAVHLIEMRVPRAHFFVFGDDPGWVVDQLDWLEPKTVVQNMGPDDDITDLSLMAGCQHHVVANSTFSWWGAWLAGAQRGLVVAPACGWTDSSGRPNDLFPPEWMVI